jgi:hypothetical protein
MRPISPVCARLECSNRAVFTPFITFTAVGHPNGARASAELGMGLCREHAVTDPDLFVDEKVWAMIVAMMASRGRKAPDRASVKIEFE